MKSRVVRLALVVMLVVAVLLCALPMGVAAFKPDKGPYPVGPGDIYDCGFTLHWEPLDEYVIKFYYNKQGDLVKLLLDGGLRGTWTRVDTGQSIEVNNGPIIIVPGENGQWLETKTGLSFWDFPQLGLPTPPGLPDVAWIKGRATELDAPDFATIGFVDWNGTAIDVCAQFPDP